MLNKTKRTIYGVIAALACTAGAQAEPTFHYGVGFGFSEVETENEGNFSGGSFGSLELLLGAENLISALPNLGVEAQFSFAQENILEVNRGSGPTTCGVDAGGQIICDVNKKLRLRATYGLQISERLEFNLAAGPVCAETNIATTATTTRSETLSGVSAGLGLTYNFDDHSIRLMLNRDEFGEQRPIAFDDTEV